MSNTIKYPFYIKLAFTLISVLSISYIICIGKDVLIPVLMAFMFSVLLLPVSDFFKKTAPPSCFVCGYYRAFICSIDCCFAYIHIVRNK